MIADGSKASQILRESNTFYMMFNLPGILPEILRSLLEENMRIYSREQ